MISKLNLELKCLLAFAEFEFAAVKHETVPAGVTMYSFLRFL